MQNSRKRCLDCSNIKLSQGGLYCISCSIKHRANTRRGKKYTKHKNNPTTFKKGQIPWNKNKQGVQIGWLKGTKGIVKPNSGSFKKGYKSWLGKHRSEETKQKLRIARSKQKLPVRDTIPEQLVGGELSRRKVNYITQYPMLNGKTIADFYLPELNVIIYADGDYWHNLSSYIERDKRITKELQGYGYKVFRFWEKDIKKNVGILLDSTLNNNN